MAEILEQLNNLKELGYIQKAHLNVLEVALEDYKTEIRAKAIDEFAERIKQGDVIEYMGSYVSYEAIVSFIDEIAEKLKGGATDEG